MTPAKNITPTYINKVIHTWQKRLQMEHIEVDVDWENEPENEDAIASVTPSDLYDYATIRFREDYVTFDKKKINRIIVHELLHIQERDLSEAVQSVAHMGFIPGPVVHIWMDRVNAASEGFIDRIAVRLVDLAGVVE